MVTTYGTPTARMILGYEDALSRTVEVMLHQTAAVARAKLSALVIGEMPWLNYHISVEELVRNAHAMRNEV